MKKGFLRKAVVGTLCAFVLMGLLSNVVLSFELDDPLSLANKLRREGKLDEALDLYMKALPRSGELSPYVRFYIGLIYLDKEDYPKALSYLEDLWRSKKSLPRELEAILPYRLAQAYESLGEIQRAYDLYLVTLALGTEYLRKLSYYRLASISYDRGEYDKSFEWILPVLQDDPNDRTANRMVLRLLGKLKSPSSEFLYRVGRAYYLKNDYAKALEYFRRSKRGFWEGISLERLGRRREAFDVYSSLIKRGEISETLVRRFVGLAEPLNLKREAYSILKGALNSGSVDKAMLLYYLYDLSGDGGIKKTLKESYPKSRWALTLSWFEGWRSYSLRKYKEAQREWSLIVRHHRDDPAYARVIYYLSKVGLYPKEKLKEELLSLFPLEYYTLTRYGISTNKKVPPMPEDRHLNRLLKVGFWEVAFIRAGLLEGLDPSSRAYYLSLVCERLSNYRSSIAYSYSLINSGWRDIEIWRRAYPLGDHFEYIAKVAKEEKVDPLLVLAVIHQESRFDPEVVSWAGAIGLMQLMPFTGRAYGVKDEDDLFSHEVNIKIGIKHLKEFLDRYNGNLYLSLAAYNAGSGNVDKWLKSIKAKDWEEWSEMIPFQETRNYVKKVLGAYRAYKELYGRSPQK